MKALTQSYTRTKARDYKSFRQTMELQSEFVEQHDLRRCRRRHRVLPRQLHSAARYAVRLDTARGRQRSGDGLAGPSVGGRDAAPAESQERLALQREQLAVVGSRARAVRRKKTIPAYVENGGESARGLHAIRVLQNKKDFTLDSLIAAAYDSYLPWFEKPLPALIKAWDRHSRFQSVEGKTGRSRSTVLRKWDRRWAVNSIPTSLAVFWGDEVRRRALAVDGARRRAGRATTRSAGQVCRGATAAVARGGVRQTAGRLRKLEDAVGRHQSIPASYRRHRPAVQRRGPQHSGGLHVLAVGIACVVRSARVSGDEEVVRHQRQQLRRGGGVRATGTGQGGDGRWRERHSGIAVTSTIKPSGTAPATCGKYTSTASNSRDTRSASIIHDDLSQKPARGSRTGDSGRQPSRGYQREYGHALVAAGVATQANHEHRF